jgi:hypothetical protein
MSPNLLIGRVQGVIQLAQAQKADRQRAEINGGLHVPWHKTHLKTEWAAFAFIAPDAEVKILTNIHGRIALLPS